VFNPLRQHHKLCSLPVRRFFPCAAHHLIGGCDASASMLRSPSRRARRESVALAALTEELTGGALAGIGNATCDEIGPHLLHRFTVPDFLHRLSAQTSKFLRSPAAGGDAAIVIRAHFAPGKRTANRILLPCHRIGLSAIRPCRRIIFRYVPLAENEKREWYSDLFGVGHPQLCCLRNFFAWQEAQFLLRVAELRWRKKTPRTPAANPMISHFP
jgi:hypothetical protein